MRRVFFDYNATTPIDSRVASVTGRFQREFFGNPSSLHWAGREVRGLYEAAREQVAEVIGAQGDEIVFTSGGTESDNHAVKGVAFAKADLGRHIITTAVEHPAVLNSCRYLETKGYTVTYLPVDGDGLINPDDLRRAIRTDTILISVIYANNETGTILPVGEIGRIGRERGILVHSDMVQALGKVAVDVGALSVDLASFSAHKVYAPKGAGALYVRRGTALESLVHGGHQESGYRAGTENVIGAVAFGEACRIVRAELSENAGRIGSLRQRLHDGIVEKVDHVRLNGHPSLRVPNTMNVSFDFVEAESLLLALDIEGIAVSAGSACSSGSGEPSHVLRAMGIPPVQSQSAVRFSLGRETSVDDVDYALSVIPDVVAKLRAMSPFARKI